MDISHVIKLLSKLEVKLLYLLSKELGLWFKKNKQTLPIESNFYGMLIQLLS